MTMTVSRGTWGALSAVLAAVVGVTVDGGMGVLAVTPPPPAVLWYAPFLSGGGYCSEAHSYVEAIDMAILARHEAEQRAAQQARDAEVSGDGHDHLAGSGSGDAVERSHKQLKEELPFSLYISQHGDSYNARFIQNIPEEMRELLQEHWIEERDLHWRLKKSKIALAVCHSEPGAWYPAHYKTSRCPPENTQYAVGRTMFETDRVPSGWADRMNKMDEIWVPTKFQRQVFVDGGVREGAVHVVPEAVDVHFFNPDHVEEPYDLSSEIASKQVTPQTTVFLSVFKWEERKCWRGLLKAYFEAFSRSDDVMLVILTNAYHVKTETAQEFMDIIATFAKEEVKKTLDELPVVYVLPPQLPQTQLPSLYKAATAFVLPSRGEGWGRPHVEAMAMGLPIISTFWSGTTEYMTEDNSYPLRIDGLIEIKEGAFRGHKWAEPSIKHLIELLQRVKAHPDEAREKGRRARHDMVTKYSPEIIGQVLLGHIERVLAIVSKRDAAHDAASAEHETHDEL